MKQCLHSAASTQKTTFNRWSRNSYAVFQSLKAVVKISFLVSAITLTVAPFDGYSQQDTIKINDHLDIDEVVVSTNRSPKLYSEVARVVTIIPASEIQSSPAQSLQELLKFAQGVDVRQRGANGVQADVSIRGGSFDQTLFLLNGIPVNDPQTGHHNLNIPIDLESVERIEILQGPGTRVYGPNAFTGAINIITDSKTERSIRASISGGMYGLLNGSVALNYNVGKLNNFISASASGSNGYMENTDFKSQNIFYHGKLSTNAGQFDVQAGYLVKGFGAQGFYTQKYPEQYEQIKNIISSLGYTKAVGNFVVNSNAYWRRNHDRFELFREDNYKYTDGHFVKNETDTAKYVPGVYEAWNYYSKHNYHMTDVMGFNANTALNSVIGQTSVGFDFRYEHIYSNNLGNAMESEIPVPGEPRGVFDKEAEREHFNVFLEHNYVQGAFDATAGALVHYNSAYGTSFNGGLELSYKLSQSVKVFTSVNQSLRIPTFTDLYYNGPSNVGNPDLKPETAVSYELGLKGRTKAIHWHVAGFIRDAKDAIDWVKYPSDAKFTTTNFTQLTTYGAELSGRLYPQQLGLDGNVLNFVHFDYSTIYVDKVDQDSAISAYALDYLRHKFNVSADFKVYKSLGLRCDFSVQDRNGSYSITADQEVDYKPFALFDARLYYRKPAFEVFVEGNNLLDVAYNDIGGLTQPGVWVKVGLKAKLSLDRK